MRIAFLHPRLDMSDGTARLVATVRAALVAGHEVSVVTRKGSHTSSLLGTGAPVFIGELPTQPVLGYFAMRRARRQIAELEPQLLHVTDEALAPLAVRIADALQRPYVQEVLRPIEARLEFSPQELRAVILPCESFVERTVNAGQVPRSWLRVLEHAPNLERDWLPRQRIEGRRPVVIAIGTLDREHGFDVLVEATRLLVGAGRRLDVLILGEGPEEDALRRQVREAQLSDVVSINCATMPNLNVALSQADLHVSPTRTGSPGWSAFQALGMGVPSIFTATSSSFGRVEDKKNGLLIQRNDPMKLSESISMLLENPTSAKQMGVQARARMLELDGAERYAEDVGRIHSDALGLVAT